MDVFISADMEGASGVATAEDVMKAEPEYAGAQQRMVGDVNAAVAGAVDGGADSVLVNDAHATMRNIDPSSLSDDADLVRGNTKPGSMMEGLTREYDIALFVGYHAMAGTQGAVLNHTFHPNALIRLSVNGVEVGELGWNARLASANEVPVGLVTGDTATVDEAKAALIDVRTVAVKTAIDRFSAAMRPPNETREEIRTEAEWAVESADEFAQIPVETPVTMTAEWATTNMAARGSSNPAVTRVDARRTRIETETYPAGYRACVSMLRSCIAGRDENYG